MQIRLPKTRTGTRRFAVDQIASRESRLLLQLRKLRCGCNGLTARNGDAISRVTDRILQQFSGRQAAVESSGHCQRFAPSADRSSNGVRRKRPAHWNRAQSALTIELDGSHAACAPARVDADWIALRRQDQPEAVA